MIQNVMENIRTFDKNVSGKSQPFNTSVFAGVYSFYQIKKFGNQSDLPILEVIGLG